MTMTREDIAGLADGYPPQDNRDWAERTQYLARALLAALDDLDAVKGNLSVTDRR